MRQTTLVMGDNFSQSGLKTNKKPHVWCGEKEGGWRARQVMCLFVVLNAVALNVSEYF